MIKDIIYKYDWKITILYECTCDDIDYIISALRRIHCPHKYIKEAIDNLETCNLNTGLTYSNANLKSSVIVINKTSSFGQTVNSISHEYYHLLQHLAKVLNINDEEELASLNGDLNMYSYNFLIDKLNKVDS